VWIITPWQCISPEVTVKGFKECCISSALERLIWYEMVVKRTGMLEVSVRKIKKVIDKDS
jgi:hypothetical protein